MLPRSGGQYVFVRRALGEYPGFIVGWSDWISTCATTSAVAIVSGEYLGVLVPPLAGRTAVVAAALVLGLTTVLWRGIEWGGAVQQFTSLLKGLVLVGLVAAVFALGSAPVGEGQALAVPTGLALFTALAVAMQGVVYTYDGWTGLIYFSGEVRNPGRDVPRAMVGGVLLVIAIYLLLNLAFLHVLPMSRLAHEPFAAGAAAEAVFGPRGDTIIRVIMIVSAIACINSNILMAPRVPLAMADDGLLPESVTRVSPGGTPTTATLLSGAISLGFIATGTFERILALLAFFFVANYLLSFWSVCVLRRREPDLPRLYRVWGFPWTTGIAALGSAAFLVGQVAGDTRNSLFSLLLLAVSYPVYRVARKAERPRGR
jgi:APA family basic amino acid/polyamine antiporter